MPSRRKETIADRFISGIAAGILGYITGFLYWLAILAEVSTVASESIISFIPGPQWLIVFALGFAVLGFIFPSIAINSLGWLWEKFVSIYRYLQ